MTIPTSWTRRAQARSAARADGAKAARYGLSRDVNPHGAGTERWRSWNAGWRSGMQTICEIITPRGGSERGEG